MDSAELMTTRETAAYLRVTVGALAQMRYRGIGPDFIRLSSRSIRYRREDLDEWVGRCAVPLPRR